MAIASHSDLVAAVGAWLNRDDLAGNIPDFIALAEADLGRKLRLRQMIKRATAVMDEEYEALPPDWLEGVSLTLQTVPAVMLEYVTPAQMAAYKGLTMAGSPRYYTIKGSEFQLYPAPNGETVEMEYFATIPALSADAPTNWLLALSPDAYLYGALTSSAPFLREDERVATWAQLYQNAIDGLTGADERAKRSGAPLSIRASVRW